MLTDREVRRIQNANNKIKRIDKLIEFLKDFGFECDDLLGGSWLIPVNNDTIEDLPEWIEDYSKSQIIINGVVKHLLDAFDSERCKLIKENGIRKAS